MEYAIAFTILFVVTAIIWVASLFIYSSIGGDIDLGSLAMFAVKSIVLVAIATLVMFIPYGGWLALGVWWLGAVFLFGMEFWEARYLVLVIWGLGFLIRMLVFAAMLSVSGPS